MVLLHILLFFTNLMAALITLASLAIPALLLDIFMLAVGANDPARGPFVYTRDAFSVVWFFLRQCAEPHD